MIEGRSTIAAIATPPGPGLRGAIRVSGPRAFELGRASCRFDDPLALAARGGWRGRFDDSIGTLPVLALAMPGPRSFTGEDVLELHLPGSAPLLAAALARLVALGAELARPGEFTRRAFESGRIDLTRAEGVLALVEAANESERRAASELLFGGLAERLEGLRSGLFELRVLCEASLDFDEADTGHVPLEDLVRLGAGVRERLGAALAWERRRARRGGRPRVVLAGPPNAGKSTLFNALTGARALTSELAGTTRDALTASWVVAGIECELVDTAGISDTGAELAVAPGDVPEPPDSAAQRHSRAEHDAADLILRVYDARGPAPEAAAGELLVRAQCDRARGEGPGVAVSALRGEGLGELGLEVGRRLGLRTTAGVGRELHERHALALVACSRSLDAALELARAGGPLDLVAEGLRAALDSLDEIGGRTSPEDLLDGIFARFCLGK